MTMKLGVFVTCVAFMVTGSLGECSRRQPCVLNARENETVILKCQFKDVVEKCWWSYSGPAINHERVSMSYRYLDNEDKDPTNCSIKIPKITEELHERTYECVGVTESWEIIADRVYALKVERDKPTELVAEPIVVEHPQDVTVFFGDPFSMSCVFSDTVNGTWTYEAGRGSGDGNLSYSQALGQITNPNTNFSVVINATYEDDYGTWWCSDLDRPEITSLKALVFVYGGIIFGPPASVRFFEGQDVELDCWLTFPANCTWLQDDVEVAIGHLPRVKYLQNNGTNTYQCSIHISEAREMDEGNWTCVASFNNVGQRKSPPASVDLNSITGHPENVTVRKGYSVTLTCAYTFEGECSWQHNGSLSSYKVPVHRESNGNICSVQIPEVGDGDEGPWRCLISSANHSLHSSEAWLNLDTSNIGQEPAPWQPSLWFYLGLTTVLIATITELFVCAWCCCHKLRKQRPTFQGTSRRMGSCSCSCKDDSDSQGASEDAHHCVNRSGTETGYEYADTVVATGVLMQQPVVINRFGNVFGYANHEIALGRSNSAEFHHYDQIRLPRGNSSK